MMDMICDYFYREYNYNLLFFIIPVGSESMRGCMIILFGYKVIPHKNKYVNYVCLFNMIMMKYCLSFQ